MALISAARFLHLQVLIYIEEVLLILLLVRLYFLSKDL